MYWYSRLFQSIRQVGQKIDPASLGVRLTVGVATVSALGLAGVAIWMSVAMQSILVATHKQNLEYIGDRFPQDVKIYSDMISMETGIQKAIDNLTTDNTLLWVKNARGQIIAKSSPIKIGSRDRTLSFLVNVPYNPELQKVNGRYWLLCKNALAVKGVDLGQVYIAQDITSDQIMFLSLVRNFLLASLVAIGLTIGAIAWYVRRSLYPLKQISQLTANISVARLGEVQLQLKNPPTEVKELAQMFDRMLVRLSQAWEKQRQLIGDVSHELRTPLTVVSGYLQSILRRENNLTPSQREALEIAASEAARTIQLLQDLLELERADSGRMYFDLQSVILNEFIEEVVKTARECSDRQIQFNSFPNLIAIKADPNRLKQVLLNLIDNAVNYSERDPIIITTKLQQMQAIIQISDRGIGIPLTQQARIFDRFYRVDETRSRTTGGTGLGLSIVKTLVEGMGGNISVYSQMGKGSTFTVSFPLWGSPS
ncbi:MAG: HAMP domain-containing histidine kinase [Hydrococcus sp. Prado102]|jgi:signal transduction histidine kinase|nr:HAMP domain-containing histidine kinase [Hydrococcus sp. Prado102]